VRSLLNTAHTILALGIASAASAQVLVTSDIAGPGITTWTANNVYSLQQQIYVLPGATLVIEPGTVIASTTNIGGALAVCRGAQIFIQGTERNPVVMTSTADAATWVGGDPKTGTWREAANEWGNLTLMGSGYVSENATPGNTPAASAANYATMEGLTAAFPGDTRIRYGGGNDDDDSGSISYVSLRYTGKVIALNNELNGLSLGGIGRNTDIHHVDIMNNVDDGIEIWGGTVNLKYVNVWNIGDDSIDVDQGWRGMMQFGLVVQGHALNAGQGSGVGDNCFEIDGAEDSNWEPVTTSTFYNFTTIGQPVDGDHGTAWRDNARAQFRNCVFMDLGERAVAFDNVDGDGGSGYGFGGTLTWAATWTTPYTASTGSLYTVQTSGNLIEIKDTVYFNNTFGTAYTEANARGVFAPANNNVQATSSPIVSITRGAPVTRGGKIMVPVTSLNPLPANDALTPVSYAGGPGNTADSAFFDRERVRGAFRPGVNWTLGWTAADAFGFMVRGDNWTDLGVSAPGTNGAPVLSASGTFAPSTTTTFNLNNGPGFSFNAFVFGFNRVDFALAPFGFPGVTLVPNINSFGYVGVLSNSLPFTLPPGGLTGAPMYVQCLVFDAGAPGGIAASNAIFKVAP
jgi:hypothetical protein